jgi:thiamine biosynthesis lipoprotein
MNAPLAIEAALSAAIGCVRARPLLGTVVEIAAYGADAESARCAVERAFGAVEEVHRLMSYHDPDSEVSRINREAATQPVAVGRHTWRVLEAAGVFAQASDGLFDITVATTLAALGFLPRHPGLPRASGQGDWRHVELLPGQRVRLARGLRVDLGGIAKGYAVDRAIETLKAAGLSAGRVNAGGDLRVFGALPQRIQVRHPGAPTELFHSPNWSRVRPRPRPTISARAGCAGAGSRRSSIRAPAPAARAVAA